MKTRLLSPEAALKSALSLLLCLAFSLGASADVLLIDEVNQVERMEVPENGLSKAEVTSRFGEPSQRHGAVGDPPISRWDYDGYSVYFEYELVLFTVLAEGRVVESS